MIVFTDRSGGVERLDAAAGDRIGSVLSRARIPPASVIVTRRGSPVSDDHILGDGPYEAKLIEGYDIATIRAALGELETDADDAPFVARHLALEPNGRLRAESAPLSMEQLAASVEDRVATTCRKFGLLPPGSSVLVGLSGGVDSSALLLALHAARPRVAPAVRIVAATFADADSSRSPGFARAASLADGLGIEHVTIPAERAMEVFDLNAPLEDVLPGLTRGPHAHNAMYVDHHTTRRVLEVEADERGIDRISLGLHTSDIVAGLLNGFMTGHVTGNLPSRPVGPYVYIYPLVFVSKRELHLYYLHRTGRIAAHTPPNEWEHHPADRSFYYWLADRLQADWPGLEIMLVAAQESRARTHTPLAFSTCTNCGGAQLKQPFEPIIDSPCDVCRILASAGFLSGKGVPA